MQRYQGHGMPARDPLDSHAIDGEGGEYFAIAVETLVYDHDTFCGPSYSDEERKWLADNYGDCLKQLSGLGNGLAPCYPGSEDTAKQTAQDTETFTSNMNRTPDGPECNREEP